MNRIDLKAYGKINLGLDVVRKRPDGYHDLDMIMQTVGIYDDVTIEKTGNGSGITVRTDASVLPEDAGNLAYRAAELLLNEFQIEQGVDIQIRKVIPIAGGMAGGSSDCAAVLKGINELFSLGLDKEALMKRGVTLGADVPYCLMGGTALARGIGDELTRLPAPPPCHIVVAKPGISVSTAYVYGHIRPERIEKRPDIQGIIDAITAQDLKRMAELLYNVMEEVTVGEHPVIHEIKQEMIENGALNAIMSGSGPTVFGLFEEDTKAEQAMQILKQKNLAEGLYLTHFVNETDYLEK